MLPLSLLVLEFREHSRRPGIGAPGRRTPEERCTERAVHFAKFGLSGTARRAAGSG